MSTIPNEMTLEALRSVPLFATLTDAATTELRRLLKTKNVAAGTQLFHKGDNGDAMYLLETGRVRISITDEDRKEITLAEFGGSWKFIGVSVALIVLWIIFNSYILFSGFDPKPYQMLNLVLAVIAGMQAPIIMMSQNRQGEKDRLRADLDYQVNLKNELSLAEVLRRLDVLESERLPKLFEEQNTRLAPRIDSSKTSVQRQASHQ